MKIISQAIAERRVLSVVYPPGLRLIEPHVLGRSANGDPLLRAYQREGASASGEHEHWKLFRVDRIVSAALTEISFADPRPLYNRDDKAMKGGIIARV